MALTAFGMWFPSELAQSYQRFEVTYCHHLQGRIWGVAVFLETLVIGYQTTQRHKRRLYGGFSTKKLTPKQ